MIPVAAGSRGRRWLNELITDPTANAASIATRDGCSVRKVNMTVSLAFLAPELVKAAIEGRLPHGMGVVRLADLPAEWSRQHQILGLPAPIAPHSNRVSPKARRNQLLSARDEPADGSGQFLRLFGTLFQFKPTGPGRSTDPVAWPSPVTELLQNGIFYIGRVTRSSAVSDLDELSDIPLSSCVSIPVARDVDEDASSVEDETAPLAFEGCESNACSDTAGRSVACDHSDLMLWCLAADAFLRFTISGDTRNAIRMAIVPYATDSIV